MAATAAPAYVRTAAGPVYTRGEQAFVRDRSGNIKTVSAQDVERLLDEDENFSPVTAEDVAKRDVEIARSTLPEKAKAFAESAAAGAADVPLIPVRLGMRAARAAGAELGTDPDKLTGRAVVEGAVHDWAGPSDENEAATADEAYRQAATERRDVNPNTAAAGTLAGTLPWAFAGPTAAAGELGAGLGLAGRLGVQAGAGALEGAAYGEGQATDDAYIADKPLTAEKLMASMGWGALIGGGASLGLGAAGEAFRSARGAVAREAVSDEAAAAFGAAKQEAAPSAAAVDLTDGRIADAAESAGLNPAARREAARQEAQRVVVEAKQADPTDWRRFTKEASPEAQYLHRGTVLDAASDETAKDLTAVLDRQRAIYDEIDNLQIKRDKIAQHLAADGVDETAVIGRAQEEAAALRARIAEQRAQVQARKAELQPAPAPAAAEAGDATDALGLANSRYLKNGLSEQKSARLSGAYEGASKSEARAIARGERAAMDTGEMLPPVNVTEFEDGTIALQDGRHRLQAAREAGANEVLAKVSRMDAEGNIIGETLRPVSIERRAAKVGRAKAPKTSGAEKALADMDTIARDHEARLLAAETGDDAIATYDSLRRELARRWRTSRGSGRASQAYEDRALFEMIEPFAQREYKTAADALMDERFVGKSQAAAQKAVNNARVGSINAETYDLRPFVQQVGSEQGADFGGRVYMGNQDAIRGMFEKLGPGGGGVRADQFARYIDAQTTTLQAIRDNYALSAGAARQLDESLASFGKMRESVGAATDAANTVNRAKARIEADQIGGGFFAKLAASTAMGGVQDGVPGAAKGFARGLLGGAGPTLELQQRLATLASSEESRLAAWFEDKIGKVSGTAGKGAAVVNRTAQTVDEKVAGAMDGYFGRIKRAAASAESGVRKATSLGRAAAAPTALKLFLGDDKPEDGYRKRVEQLLIASQGMGAGIRTNTTRAMGGLAETAPRITQHVAVAASRAANYLLANTPVPTRAPSVINPGYRPMPSDAEIASFAKRWAAVSDPMTVLEDFQKGMVTYEQVDALKNVYPSLYQSIRVEALERFQQLDAAGVPVPYNDRLQADLMFDLHGAGDPTLDPGFALKVSGMMQKAKQQVAQPRPRAQPVNVAKGMASGSQMIGATLRGVT